VGFLKQRGEKLENQVLACDLFLYDYFSGFPHIGHYHTYFEGLTM